MLPGPKLSKMFFYALLRFRSYFVALVADLTEIFSQVTMAEKEGGYHPFLWGGGRGGGGYTTLDFQKSMKQ